MKRRTFVTVPLRLDPMGNQERIDGIDDWLSSRHIDVAVDIVALGDDDRPVALIDLGRECYGPAGIREAGERKRQLAEGWYQAIPHGRSVVRFGFRDRKMAILFKLTHGGS